MSKSSPIVNSPCPHLPTISELLPITHTRKHREACGPDYFQSCRELAQSLWLSGSPAQAILQLDKSFMASTPKNLPLAVQDTYQAILWIIQNAPDDQFLGNPVRHFQHLASRMNMNQPNAKLRIWRAWACLHLTEKFSPEKYPRDTAQTKNEALTIPNIKEVLENITDEEERKTLHTLLT